MTQTIAIIGYNETGKAKAQQLQTHGIKVIFGLRAIDDNWEQVAGDGWDVYPLEQAIDQADIIQIW